MDEKPRDIFEAILLNENEDELLYLISETDLDITDPAGYTPLYYAVKQNLVNVARRLVEQGANVNAKKEPYQKTPLELAEEIANEAMCGILQAGNKHSLAPVLSLPVLERAAKDRHPTQSVFVSLEDRIARFIKLSESAQWTSQSATAYLDQLISELDNFIDKFTKEKFSNNVGFFKFMEFLIQKHEDKFLHTGANWNTLIEKFTSLTKTVVPNVIHFIWAGGNIIPEREFSTVKSWREACPNHSVILWIDKKTTSNEEIEAFSLVAKQYGIELWDITEQGIVTPQIRHELDSVNPNYGKSSDLLRYAALAKFGGVYLDTDVLCNQALPVYIYAPKGFLMPPWSQGQMDVLSNDIFFAVPNTDIISRINVLAQQSCLVLIPTIYRRRHECTPYNFRRMSIVTTGPVFLREALHTMGLLAPNQHADKVRPFNSCKLQDFDVNPEILYHFEPTEHSTDQLRWSFCEFAAVSGGNYASWIKHKASFLSRREYNEQIRHIVSLICYEAKEMHVFLLQKYFDYYEESLKTHVDFQKFVDDLFSSLREHLKQAPGLMKNLQLIQFDIRIAKSPIIIDFFKEFVSANSEESKTVDNIDALVNQITPIILFFNFSPESKGISFSKFLQEEYPSLKIYLNYLIQNFSPYSVCPEKWPELSRLVESFISREVYDEETLAYFRGITEDKNFPSTDAKDADIQQLPRSPGK